MTDLVAQAVAKMVEFYNGNTHDVRHFIKVHSYAATIGRLEGLDEETLTTLELAAIVHDIAIPLCREKYGSADGKHQEQEGPALARKFMQELGVDEKRTQRVEYMVGHHHTYTNVDGVDMRILLEADFLVNADVGRPAKARHSPDARACIPHGDGCTAARFDLLAGQGISA